MTDLKQPKKCSYIEFCYIAEARDCFGYKTDCPLYMVTNEEDVNESRFHRAMDELINKTKAKHIKPQLLSGDQI
jgi:hypothetical protein